MAKRKKRLSTLTSLIVSIVALMVLILVSHWESVLPPSDNAINGRAYVHDGDTISIGKQKIRLEGIDAPELAQQCKRGGKPWACGETATAALRKKVSYGDVRCTITGKDRYQRMLGHCWQGKTNLNGWMVKNGHALAYQKYSNRYVPEEIMAQRPKVGLHTSVYVEPWEWRKQKRNR